MGRNEVDEREGAALLGAKERWKDWFAWEMAAHRLAGCKIQGFRPNINKSFHLINHKSITRTPTTMC